MKLYRVSVEEKVKENVVVGGQEWNNSTQTEVSSDSVFLHEGKNSSNKLFLVWVAVYILQIILIKIEFTITIIK